MTEAEIMHENERYWVTRQPGQYTVFRNQVTSSVSDSAYPTTPDSLSLAKVRCDYLARREKAA